MYPKLSPHRTTAFFRAAALFFLVTPASLPAGGQRPAPPDSKLVSAQPFMEQLEQRGDERIRVGWKWTRDERDPNVWTIEILEPKGWDKAALLVDDVVATMFMAPHNHVVHDFGKYSPGVHRVTLAVTQGRDYGFKRRGLRVTEPEGPHLKPRSTPPARPTPRN